MQSSKWGFCSSELTSHIVTFASSRFTDHSRSNCHPVMTIKAKSRPPKLTSKMDWYYWYHLLLQSSSDKRKLVWSHAPIGIAHLHNETDDPSEFAVHHLQTMILPNSGCTVHKSESTLYRCRFTYDRSMYLGQSGKLEAHRSPDPSDWYPIRTFKGNSRHSKPTVKMNWYQPMQVFVCHLLRQTTDLIERNYATAFMAASS